MCFGVSLFHHIKKATSPLGLQNVISQDAQNTSAFLIVLNVVRHADQVKLTRMKENVVHGYLRKLAQVLPVLKITHGMIENKQTKRTKISCK